MNRRGSVRVGADADLVALSADIVGHPYLLGAARVVLTIAGGQTVFDGGAD